MRSEVHHSAGCFSRLGGGIPPQTVGAECSALINENDACPTSITSVRVICTLDSCPHPTPEGWLRREEIERIFGHSPA